MLVPTFEPFFFHWYAVLVPPLVGVAVQVTDVPAVTLLAEAEMLIPAATVGVTVMVTWFDVAGLPVVHDRLDVSTQVTTSLFVGL